MGDDTALEARMETVAQRVEFIELLADEGPLPPRDIVDALSHSRATVTRALRELREANLVEKHEGDYGPTLAGKMAADQYRQYQRASEAVLSVDSLLGPIPGAHAPPVEILVDADTILAEGEIPVRALEAVSDRVQRADAVQVYLPTLVNTHLLRVWHRAVLAGSVESVALFDPDLLTVLKGQYPHLLAEMASADGFDAYSTPGPPYGLVLTTIDGTTSLAVIVYEDETKVRGVLTNDAPAAVDWVAERLERLRIESNVVTGELEALSDAVADGVAPLRSPPAGTIRSLGSGETTAAMAAEGHDLPIDLEAEGFVRLSEGYFESHGLAEPTVSWRTGFTLAEVHGGHSVDRLDVEGRNLTDRLVEDLKTGTDHVVLGPPGSGKSTVCMAVACEWYDRRLGPVLYRERGDGDRFESTALLEAYLRQTRGHALVVIEDAVRDDVNRIFEVMQSIDAEPSVTFLLDARAHEWRGTRGVDIDARRDAYRRSTVESLEVPDLDERECERFVEHFADLVEADLNLTGSELFAMVEEGTAAGDDADLSAGDTLVAQYHLARHHNPPVDADASAVTALDEAARRTYERFTAHPSPCVADLAVLVAVLTAAGVPVAVEYLYAIADANEYPTIDEAVSELQGELLFEPDRPGKGDPTTYRTRHETWATRFLAQVLAIAPVESAQNRVGGAVTQLLALADDGDRRARIQQHLGGRTPHLHRIEADPQRWADELADRLFDVGLTAAELAPLFGETTDDRLELPDACSEWIRLKQAYWRGEMNRTHGDLARAEREYRTLEELAVEVDLSDQPTRKATIPEFATPPKERSDQAAVHRARWRATSFARLGTVARDRGEYETAEEHHAEALERFREIDDRGGEAISLKNLGAVAFYQSNFDRAREYYQNGLELAIEIGARRTQADCLNNLGGVAWKLGAFDRAREHLERSLAISRELADEQAEYSILNNLGDLAQAQDDYDQAREYYEQSLAIFRERGDRPSEATILTNLGQVAKRKGVYDQAREYFERSLTIKRDLDDRPGEAQTLRDLGEVDRAQGAFDRARDRFERSLRLERELGDRQGAASSEKDLGTVAVRQGDIDRAREHIERSLEFAQELDAQSIEANSCIQLAEIAHRSADYARAEEQLERARAIFETLGSDLGTARSRLVEARVAMAEDDIESARELARAAVQTFEAIGARHWIGRGHQLLGRIEAAAGRHGQAREQWDAALESFETVGAPQDALATLQARFETCRERGDEVEARNWCRRARDQLEDAPPSTSDIHREWVERHAAELGDG